MKKKISLRQKVYTSLKLDIISGKFKGGTRLTENFIADSLNVSRTPVREALQKLTQEKLLTAIPKAGYLIEDLSDSDIRDLFENRMAIELIAFQKAANQISLEELKTLDDNLEKTKTAIKSKENFTITELDIEFHEIIYKAARSKTLFRVCKNLSDLTIKYRHRLNLDAHLANESMKHHVMIYQAILSKDNANISQVLSVHAQQANAHLADVMKKLRSDAFEQDDF